MVLYTLKKTKKHYVIWFSRQNLKPATKILNLQIDCRYPVYSTPQKDKSWSVMCLCVMGVRGGENLNYVNAKTLDPTGVTSQLHCAILLYNRPLHGLNVTNRKDPLMIWDKLWDLSAPVLSLDRMATGQLGSRDYLQWTGTGLD